ncbi:hypothetical protein TSOC_012564 [Tetrabaena socialis]|uniref:Uncharacterized protein n=1 Tax=Tetrabaena socialis TaxID=47790 RepID=A0A2J7ZMP2_9CHLO|nr:hypothetical protein TSOC_012564 [Tetrabaena socialis]|eukprot:PNH01539.1 hypothetical protein TSOC_012564 [Tetrabaena socialis]
MAMRYQQSFSPNLVDLSVLACSPYDTQQPQQWPTSFNGSVKRPQQQSSSSMRQLKRQQQPSSAGATRTLHGSEQLGQHRREHKRSRRVQLMLLASVLRVDLPDQQPQQHVPYSEHVKLAEALAATASAQMPSLVCSVCSCVCPDTDIKLLSFDGIPNRELLRADIMRTGAVPRPLQGPPHDRLLIRALCKDGCIHEQCQPAGSGSTLLKGGVQLQ